MDVYNQALVKGEELLGELKSFRVRPSTNQLLKDLYQVKSGRIGADRAVPDDLVREYVKVASMKWVEISSPSAGKYDDAFYSHYVSGDGGLLVVDEIHKDRDKNRLGQRFDASEMAWQSFLLGAEQDGVQPSRLRSIIISHIVNDNTKNVILETTRVSTSTLSKDYDHKEFTEVDGGFYTLLGSVLGKSVMHMLLDHKAETGYRTVDRVGQEYLDPKKARSPVICLSEPRPRKRAATDRPSSSPSIKRRRLSNSVEYIFGSQFE